MFPFSEGGVFRFQTLVFPGFTNGPSFSRPLQGVLSEDLRRSQMWQGICILALPLQRRWVLIKDPYHQKKLVVFLITMVMNCIYLFIDVWMTFLPNHTLSEKTESTAFAKGKPCLPTGEVLTLDLVIF